MRNSTQQKSTGLSPIVEDFMADWNAAAIIWDHEGLTNRYTEDALFHGGRSVHSVGRDAIRAYFESYTGKILSCALRLRDQHVLEVDANVLVVQGFGEFSFVLEEDTHTRSVVRTTLMLVCQQGEWKARLHHFSPIPAQPPLGQEN